LKTDARYGLSLGLIGSTWLRVESER